MPLPLPRRIMTTTRPLLLFPLFTLVGVMACSGKDTGGSQGTTGGAPHTGGATASGGALATGGAPASGGKPTTGGTTATGGAPASGGTTAKGGSVASGGTVSSGGSTAAGGAAAAGGKTGSGGSSAGGSSAGLTLDQACTAMCASQTTIACPVADCQTACVSAADATVSAITKCNTQYTAMARCEANLGADKWTCSSDENVPIPVQGQCTDTVCAWACCATDLIVPSDIWARCQNTCAQPGTGGTSGTGGNSGSGGASGSGGKTGSGGIGATGGKPGGSGGAGGAPPTTGIPAGYPAPTAANYAKCQKVAVGTNDACGGQPNGNVCIECLFGGTDYNTSETTPTATGTSEAGNYVVTVTLGGAAAGDTYVSAESTRGMLKSVTTTPGQSLTYAFVVNVRAMEGQPKHSGGPGGYPGLDLFFSGTNPQVSAIGYALADATTKPIMVYVAGDSTTCDQTGGAFGGWAQMLPEYLGPPVGIANYANSGAASGDYGFWGDISSRWTKGDWIIIQFGHNDKTDSDATVEANLTPHVKAALAAGVNPIMVSPPARLQGIPIPDQSGLHAAALKAVATANNVPFIDLTALSTAFYNASGMTKDQALTAYHANGKDPTHTSLPGADMLAGLVAKAIKDQNIGLAQYLRQ
jgi:lysophospholipase L1-like esterase